MEVTAVGPIEVALLGAEIVMTGILKVESPLVTGLPSVDEVPGSPRDTVLVNVMTLVGGAVSLQS